ncbi:cobalamin biosynthesis protein [Streptomyces diastatochromogenes]|nr:cobalamin biosynthesis protein [Streptomyces diastatochromogenes]
MTTATDAVGLPGLDTLGFPFEGSVATVSRALLDGEGVVLEAEVPWPLPPLPTAPQGSYTVRLTDRAVAPGEREVLLRPPSLVVGVGASKGAPVEEVLGLVVDALREAGLSPKSLAELATVDAKSEEPGIVAAAERLGVPLVTYPAEELAAVEVPNPSDAPLSAVGTLRRRGGRAGARR